MVVVYQFLVFECLLTCMVSLLRHNFTFPFLCSIFIVHAETFTLSFNLHLDSILTYIFYDIALALIFVLK